jgi:hypothetical protein
MVTKQKAARKPSAASRRRVVIMLDAGTINRLRLEVPRGKRSEFIQRAIETALLDRKLDSRLFKMSRRQE